MPLAWILNINGDEFYSLRTTSDGLRYAYRTAIGFEAMPPLYPVVLDLWRQLDRSIFFGRMLSELCCVASLLLAWRFAVKRSPRIVPALFVAVIAIAPFFVYAALEMRQYAMAMMLSFVLLVTFFEGFVDDSRSLWARIVHGLAVAVCVYVQYYVGAQVLGEGVALLVLRRWKTLSAYVLWTFPALFCWLPVKAIVAGQLGAYGGGTLHSGLRGVLVTLTSFWLPSDWRDQFAGNHHVILAYAVVAALCALALGVARPRLTRDVAASAAIVLTIVAFFIGTTAVLHQALLLPRHAVTLYAPALALLATAIASTRFLTRPIVAVLTLLYVASAFAAHADTYGTLSKSGNFARAADFLSAHDPGGLPIFAFNMESVGPLGVYYRGDAPLLPIPHAQNFSRWNPDEFALTSRTQAREPFRSMSPGERAFIYLGGDCFTGDDPLHCSYLRDVLASDFTTISTTDIPHAQILEVVKR